MITGRSAETDYLSVKNQLFNIYLILFYYMKVSINISIIVYYHLQTGLRWGRDGHWLKGVSKLQPSLHNNSLSPYVNVRISEL